MGGPVREEPSVEAERKGIWTILTPVHQEWDLAANTQCQLVETRFYTVWYIWGELVITVFLSRVFLTIRWGWGITNTFENKEETYLVEGKTGWGLDSPSKTRRKWRAFSRQERGAVLIAWVKWASYTMSERQELSCFPSWAVTFRVPPFLSYDSITFVYSDPTNCFHLL